MKRKNNEIRDLRVRTGKSRKELSDCFGCDVYTIGRYERTGIMPDERWYKLLALAGVTEDDYEKKYKAGRKIFDFGLCNAPPTKDELKVMSEAILAASMHPGPRNSAILSALKSAYNLQISFYLRQYKNQPWALEVIKGYLASDDESLPEALERHAQQWVRVNHPETVNDEDEFERLVFDRLGGKKLL